LHLGKLMRKAEKAMKITVVIPFYQRETGLLERAVASILAQDMPAPWRVDVIIIDDGSPLPAKDERLDGMPEHIAIRIIEQANGGVGAARNAGISAADPATAYLAFLDSDDEWGPLHLVSAIEQLDSDADFYFDNNIIDEGRDAFSYSAFMQAKYGKIDPGRPFIGIIDGQEGFNAILHECLPHTSQVVYNFQRHASVRFETDMRRAGEDQIFWLTLAHRSKRIAYSTAINGRRGVGISIYRESLAWDSLHGLSRVADEILMRTTIRRKFDLTADQKRLLQQDAQRVCDHFAFLAVRNARKQPRQLSEAILRLTRHSPSFWRMIPGSLLRLPSYVRKLRREAQMAIPPS
jgi:succinoglycan biosynthesis protein ExoW